MGSATSSSRTAATTTVVARSQFRSLSCSSTVSAEKRLMLAIRERYVLADYCVAGAAAANSSKDVNVQDVPFSDTIIETSAAEVVADEPVDRRKSLKDNLATAIGAGGELSALRAQQYL
jgi:hypothetical protein